MKKLLLIAAMMIFMLSGCVKAQMADKISELTEDLEESEDEINELEDKIEALNSLIDELTVTTETAQDEINALNEENNGLSQEISDLTQENQELNETIETLKGPDLSEVMGGWEGNTYQNSYFNFSLTKPSSWSYSDEEELAQLVGLSLEISSDASGVSINSVEEGTIVPLLYTYPGNNVDNATSSILISMTKTSVQYDLVDYANTYVSQIEAILSSYGDLTIDKIAEAEIGGADASIIRVSLIITGSDIVLFADYYYLYSNGYLCEIAVTYLEEDAAEINDVIATLIFE